MVSERKGEIPNVPYSSRYSNAIIAIILQENRLQENRRRKKEKSHYLQWNPIISTTFISSIILSSPTAYNFFPISPCNYLRLSSLFLERSWSFQIDLRIFRESLSRGTVDLIGTVLAGSFILRAVLIPVFILSELSPTLSLFLPPSYLVALAIVMRKYRRKRRRWNRRWISCSLHPERAPLPDWVSRFFMPIVTDDLWRR